MNNILLSELFKNEKNCFNCNNYHIDCHCKYNTYYSSIGFYKYQLRINYNDNIFLYIEKNLNQYNIYIYIDAKQNNLTFKFVVDDMHIKDLFEKIEGYLIFQ